MDTANTTALKQHLIDPEVCIRCNTCEATCPVGAITHDDNNYVVDAEKCNFCMACISPCPTGSIDNWRVVPAASPYSLEAQFSWEVLPEELPAEQLADLSDNTAGGTEPTTTDTDSTPHTIISNSASVPPWSAAHVYTNLYGPKSSQPFITAKVTGNFRVTKVGKEYDTHHIVLDFGSQFFPVLEGQSIGIIAPGFDNHGRPHHARQYSIASPRNGERPGYNNLSLTVKRVLEDREGNPVHGVASNYVCDLQVGDEVKVIGPFGHSFLMPNHSPSNILMICTGTGSAPMRAMTEWRRRHRDASSGKLMLFFGARTKDELPYFGPLMNLPKDFMATHLAFSRDPEHPKRYVQDLMREQSAQVKELLADRNTYIYVCGLKSMEEGVLMALKDIADQNGLHWATLHPQLREEGRIHFETY